MKTIFLTTAVLASTFLFGQVDKKEITTTQKTILTNENGEVMTAEQEVTKNVRQKVLLKEDDVQKVNYTAKRGLKHINYDVTYSFNGIKYKIKKVDKGYGLYQVGKSNNMFARLLPTSRKNTFTFYQNGENAVAYFNTSNNLVVEFYNPTTDVHTVSIFKLEKDTEMQSKG